MRNGKIRIRSFASVAVAAGTIGIAGFAFTASNTVDATKAGDGAGAITGYAVSSVHYGLNSSDPTKADSVAFTLDSTPVSGSAIKVQLASSGAWYTCANTLAAVTCDTTSPQATVVAAANLRVVVAQ